MAVSIRPIKEQDYIALQQLETQIWHSKNTPAAQQDLSLTAYKEKMSHREIFVAVIEHDETPVGFIEVHHPTSLEAHKKQWMLAIGVHPNYQSQGIGQQLLNYVKEIAPNYSIHKLSLRVMATNTEAIHFYQKNGFQQEAHLKDEFFINGVFCDDFHYSFFIC